MTFVINKSARCEIFSGTDGGCTGLVVWRFDGCCCCGCSGSFSAARAGLLVVAEESKSGGSSARTSTDVPCARTDESCCDC